MYLSRKERFVPTEEQSMILGLMGYSAYKLWNVANYEKHNYQEMGMSQFPDWYDQKARLKTNFFYKNLPSQTAQDILQQLQEGWNSYFALLKSGGIENPKPPKFKHDKISITFLKDAIQQQGNIIRLTISKQLKAHLKTMNINAKFLYLKTKQFSNIDIKELQIKFIGDEFEMVAVYKVPDVVEKSDNGRYLSIDPGIKNSLTCYDSIGKSFIISGLLNITHLYDKKIAYYQSINGQQQAAAGIEYPRPSKMVKSLYQNKNNAVNDFIHKTTSYIADYCRENQINTVIIGDITHIRDGKDWGRNNQQLHYWPYAKIYQKLEYKLALYGIKFVKQSEKYSSQCGPNTPQVSKKYAKKSNRKKRGLYKDNGTIYNADSVGAYNILRLYFKSQNMTPPPHKGLSNPVKVSV